MVPAETKGINNSMSTAVKTTKRLTIGWKTRHLLVIIFSVIGVYAFLESRAQWSEMHRWNRAIGDMSLLLIAFSMAIGPISRLLPKTRAAIPWRREFGIYGVILAIIHTFIILAGWVEWELIRLLGYQLHPAGVYIMLKQGFGLGNVIGIIALFYGLVLAFSSSNWCQRVLSGPVWKYLQQSAYVLWMLIVVHTAYFLYLHFQDYHRAVPEPNWVQWPFAGLVTTIIVLQMAASWKTWRLRRDRIQPGEQSVAG